MALRVFLSCLLVYVFGAGLAYAQSPANPKADGLDRPRIGLVLGGGGAKGLSHVGVIKVLEDNQIPVDVISGTSMGAIVGSLYASGYSAAELDNIVDTIDWTNVLGDNTSRSNSTFRRKADEFGFLTDYKITFRDGKIVLPEGIIQGQNLFLELSRLLAQTRSIGNFDDLPIPLRLVATDLETGGEIIMKDGDLATAVFGSMAIPGFVPPVERDGRYLLDGGLVNNLPADLARKMGADILIVVNVGSPPKPAGEIGSFIDVLRQTQILLTQENTNLQIAMLSADDILLLPELDDLSVASFEDGGKAVQAGRAAALSRQADLRKLRLDDAQWAAHLAARKPRKEQDRIIDSIEIVQNSKLSDEIIRAGLNVRAGDTLDAAQLSRDIDRLYGTGQFSRITYKMLEQDTGNVLQVAATTKESADGYFKFGLDLDSNLENESSFKLGVSYTKPQVNRWGGEWRTEANIGDSIEAISEFYQPVGTAQRFFVEPSILLQREKTDFFDNMDIRRGELTTVAYGASLQGGMLLGRWGELRAGVTRLEGDLHFTDPLLSGANINIHDASILTRFTVDTLDSLSFPTKGTLLIAEHEYHDTFLGGEFQFNQTSVNAYKPFTTGRHTFGLGTRLSGSAGRDANILGTSNLGGFLSLAGFSEDELSGQYAAMAFGTYYYRLNKQAALFDAPVFVGGSLEAGNVYQSFDDIAFDNSIFAASGFAGVKSPLGPIFIGVGTNDKGNTSFYFSIGSFF